MMKPVAVLAAIALLVLAAALLLLGGVLAGMVDDMLGYIEEDE